MTAMASIDEPGAPDLREAMECAWREADLLDRHDYLPWLGMWTEGGRYVIPLERYAEDYAAVLNIVHDDAAMREARVKRLRSGFSMSSAPPARTVRTISRFVSLQTDPGSIRFRAAQILVEYKYERTRLLAADVTYRLVRSARGLLIDEKIVTLINADDAQFGIGYLL